MTERMSLGDYAARRGLQHFGPSPLSSTTWLLDDATVEDSVFGPLGSGERRGTLLIASQTWTVRSQSHSHRWTVGSYPLPAGDLGGVACSPRRPGVAGKKDTRFWRVMFGTSSWLPQAVVSRPLGDPAFDALFVAGVAAGDDPAALQKVFTPEFRTWLERLAGGDDRETVPRFELRDGTLCVYVDGQLDSEVALDEFCRQAAYVASHIGRVADAERAARSEAKAAEAASRPRPAGAMNRAAYAFLADRMEEELRKLGAWSDDGSKPGLPSFTQWIQFTLLPGVRAIAEGADPPATSNTSAMAAREFDGYPQADPLFELLLQLDHLVEHGMTPAGMPD